MVILLVALALSADRAKFSLIVARFRRAIFFWGLVLATEVAFAVLVMRIMAALPVVVVAITAARLSIFGVIAALLVGVLGLVAMNVARFANELRQSLPLGLVAFVFAIARRFVAVIAIAIIAIIVTARGMVFISHMSTAVAPDFGELAEAEVLSEVCV